MPNLEELQLANAKHEETHEENKERYEHWEHRLSLFGLSENQLGAAALQDIPATTPFAVAHDTKLKPGHWSTRAAKDGQFTGEEIFDWCQQLPVREQGRQSVPEWARHTDKIEELLLHLYPALGKDPKAQRSTDDQLATVRQRAARTAAQIYLAFCCNWSDYDIALALDLKEASVATNLSRVRKEGDKYFSIRRNELEAGGVLVHKCHKQGDPQPARCACKLIVSPALAKEMVKHGEADWLWVYPNETQSFQTHGAVVVIMATKTPRAALLEKAHMERNAEGYEDEQDNVAAFKEILLQGLVDLHRKEGFVEDPFKGRAVLYMPADQRTHYS